MKLTAVAVTLLALALPSGAFANMSQAGFEVNPVNDVIYEVVSEGAHGGAAFWCAAGEYAEIHLKASPQAEIYIARGAGPSVTTKRKSAAHFTLDPAAAGITPAALSNDVNVLNVGGHMKAELARNFCSTG